MLGRIKLKLVSVSDWLAQETTEASVGGRYPPFRSVPRLGSVPYLPKNWTSNRSRGEVKANNSMAELIATTAKHRDIG